MSTPFEVVSPPEWREETKANALILVRRASKVVTCWRGVLPFVTCR